MVVVVVDVVAVLPDLLIQTEDFLLNFFENFKLKLKLKLKIVIAVVVVVAAAVLPDLFVYLKC